MQRKTTYTTGEIARYCGVEYSVVARWIELGELRAHRLPQRREHRIQLPDFLDFLARHELPVPRELQPDVDAPRILIVEDEPHMARAIERVLHRAGFETRSAHDGFRAGALLGSWRPEVVTLDLRIPGLSGLDVLTFLRSTPGHEATRILVLSAQPDRELHHALRLGADRVLAKPFENQQLVSVISRLVAGREPVTTTH